MHMFRRYIGIDYSGAGAPNSRQTGLRVFECTPESEPMQITPPGDPEHWNWTRPNLGAWLIERLQKSEPTIVGIDHAFSLPMSYMTRNRQTSWDGFLSHFEALWPARDRAVKDLKETNGVRGQNDEFRLTETWTAAAKSVFEFGVPGAVASSTHAGIPWLREIRSSQGRDKVHFWPFDGWGIARGAHAIVEVYPSLFRRRYESSLEGDRLDAWSIAKWLQEADGLDRLKYYLDPPLTPDEKKIAELEGWILGVA